MLRRKIEKTLEQWLISDYGLLIDGARQIGKSFIIEYFINKNFKNVIKINLYENKLAVSVLSEAIDADDFMLRLSSLINKPFVPNQTVIFLDEIQEFKNFDIITMMKFLVKKKDFRFVVSGSLLGIQQYGINSWPEGYMMLEKMYPLDFEEFLWANGVNEDLIEIVKSCFVDRKEVSDYLHIKFLDLFKKYLMVGGMPDAVNKFIETNDLNAVRNAHKVIEQYTAKDVSKYANDFDKILIQEMYDLIPYELNNQSKRFKLSDLPSLKRNENLGLSFGWFTKAGVAIPVYNVSELSLPLTLNADHRLVKLFSMDVGILTYKLMDDDIKKSVLFGDLDLNFGAIYENAVAQSLISNGHENLFYYSKHGTGELDFVLSVKDEIVPIEVKSGKDYKKHSALNNVLNNKPFNNNIKKAYVLCNSNLSVDNNVIYMPIYMVMFI